MSTRELIENYTVYTDAMEMSHSAAADTTARTTPGCVASAISVVTMWTGTWDMSC